MYQIKSYFSTKINDHENILICLLLIVALPAFSQREVTVKVDWKFEGIIDGYNHPSKLLFYVDNKFVGESTVTLQSEPNSFAVNIPKGKHTLKIVSYAKYEGVWEEQNIENNYSFDGSFFKSKNFKRDTRISLEFNITTERVNEL